MGLFKKKPIEIGKVSFERRGNGCFATAKLTMGEGIKVGYMYREIPDSDSEIPDSGWRFFAGDETDDYVNDPDNIRILDINTICGYDPDIIKYLDAPYGSAWIRNGNKFIKDE